HPARNAQRREYAPQLPAHPCDRLQLRQRQTRDHNVPKGRAWAVDGREAIFAKLGTTSHSFGNHKTTPFECPLGLADSKSKTRQSRCPDRDAQDVGRCPHAGSELPPTRERFFGTRPHATHDLSRTRAVRPRAETNPPREKPHFG